VLAWVLVHFLKNQGLLYLSLKEGTEEGMELDDRYTGKEEKFNAYFQKKEIENLLTQSGFETIELVSVFQHKEYNAVNTIYIIAKKLESF
jgi:hypothetical protein